jgi:putative intracellular protease/amidase
MSALVFLAPGFEEIEGITVIDILRRAEIETVVAGLVTNPIMAARQTRHLAEVHLADVDPAREFEVVVLPGGAEGAKRLAESPLVRDWLFRQRERGQWVAAICAAPTALLAHDWLRPEQKITPDRSRRTDVLSWRTSSSPVSPQAPRWSSPSRSSANCAVPTPSARSTRASTPQCDLDFPLVQGHS